LVKAAGRDLSGTFTEHLPANVIWVTARSESRRYKYCSFD